MVDLKKKARTTEGFLGCSDERSSPCDYQVVVRGLAGPPVGDQLELDLLAFVQALQARALDSADMDKGVLAAVVRLDEAIAFGGVEPLHGSRSHGKLPFTS